MNLTLERLFQMSQIWANHCWIDAMAHADSARTRTNVSRLAGPDMQAVPLALARAAMRARELAFRTVTPLVVVVDGQLAHRSIQKSDLLAANKAESPL